MEKNVANDIKQYVSLPKKYEEELAGIRHFTNLQVGVANGTIWLKGIELYQTNHVALKTITGVQLYYEKGSTLYPDGSLLPYGRVPEVLWTPISRALPIEKPAYNHNYFGVESKVKMLLVPQHTEKKAAAMVVNISDLEDYISTAPRVRLQHLSWTIIGEKALILGSPLLPINGKSYWKENHFLIPTGYGFEISLLQSELNDVINEANDFVLWTTSGSYTIIKRSDSEALSLSSFRKTLKVKTL